MAKVLPVRTRTVVSTFAAIVLLMLAPCAQAVYDPVFDSGFETVPRYYVSAALGSDANPGTLARPWKTINRAVHADNGAPAGSTVYVAAGTYNEQVVVARDKMRLIGYKATPGDQPPILVNLAIDPATLDHGYAFDPADMPLLDGRDRTTGVGIEMSGRHGITLKNFSIRNYAYGVTAGRVGDPDFIEGDLVDNVNISSIGNLDADYSGIGMWFGMIAPRKFSNGNRVTNSLIVNVGAEGLDIVGNGNEANNVRVYGAESTNATDYYIIVWGNYNRVSNSYIWHKLGTPHWSHGYTVKDNADQLAGGSRMLSEHNVFENDVAVNMGESFAVRHRGVRYNTFINSTAYGPLGLPGGCGDDVGTDGSAIQIRDGARYNQFIGIKAYDTCRPLTITESVEDEIDDGMPHAPNQNVIDNLYSLHSGEAVYLSNSDHVSDAGDNIIKNSQFLQVKWPFVINLPPGNLRFIDTDFDGDGSDPIFGWGTYQTELLQSQFTGCTFTNFPLPNWW
ncbi:MAG TPA: DUF1565 domain-containing protein [Rudaea sp.]|nr:DUF1565 domain-containing protein [Rudaea sp.]